MNGETKHYHFCKCPQYGDTVKVYCNKHQQAYGTVVGHFQRIVHRQQEITTKGKTIPAYDIITDCVLLDPCIYIEFNQIMYFLNIDRIDFNIQRNMEY